MIDCNILAAISSDNLTVALVGYAIVFSALIVLFYLFSLVPKILNLNIKNRLKRQGKVVDTEAVEVGVSGEVNAAISTALYLHFDEQHDKESGVLTVKQISRRYSPWSSKIYGVMNNRLVR